MALALSSILSRGNMRGQRMVVATCTSNENYATGGIALSPNTIGLNTITAAFVTAGKFSTGGAYTTNYVSSSGKVQLFWVDTTVDGAELPEVPNATAIGVTVYTIFAFGT